MTSAREDLKRLDGLHGFRQRLAGVEELRPRVWLFQAFVEFADIEVAGVELGIDLRPVESGRHVGSRKPAWAAGPDDGPDEDGSEGVDVNPRPWVAEEES